MISNNPAATSKSFKTEENSVLENNLEEATSFVKPFSFDSGEPANNAVLLSPNDTRLQSRGRPPDFRGMGFQKNLRTKRVFSNARSDREYKEVTSKPSETIVSSFNTKYYDKSSKLVLNLPEDPRISKLLRRLCAESDIEKSLSLCTKLQDAILLPENTRYIKRSYAILVESVLDVFFDAPSPETQEQAAIVLGRIGYVLGSDFQKHLEWIKTQYMANNVNIKYLLTKSFMETFRLDYEQPNLSEFATKSMNHLQSIFEVTDVPNIFMSALNAMVTLSNSYPEEFAKYFVDTVDILVGWHVDSSQTKKIKEFSLKTLLKMSRHWQADVIFSVNLLNQFIEDMVAYSNDLIVERTGEVKSTPEECIQKITSFMNVFNAVVKSLDHMLNPNQSKNVSWPILINAATEIQNVLLKGLKFYWNDDLLLAGNECIYLLFDILQSKLPLATTSLTYELIDLELQELENSDDFIKISICNLIAKCVKEVSSNLPVEFITKLIGGDSCFKKLRCACNGSVLNAILSVYINLLNLKNIPLLQETYKCVLSDLQYAYNVLGIQVDIIPTSCNEDITKSDAEKFIIFYLQSLSELANASNSIIGMWALQPSILELLAVKMQPYQPLISQSFPLLQYSILFLVYSHSKKNNYFIASSDLLSNLKMRSNVVDIFGMAKLSIGEIPTSSPTSGHFSIILSLLNNVFLTSIHTESLLLLLRWSMDILIQLESYLPMMNQSKSIIQLIASIVSVGNSFDSKVIELVGENLKIIIKNKKLSWNIHLLNEIANLCLIHIDNCNKEISLSYETIMLGLPWDIIHMQIDKMLFEKYQSVKKDSKFNLALKINSIREYLMKGSCVQISNYQFTIIINSILKGYFHENMSLLLASCLPLKSDESNLLFQRYVTTNFTSMSSTYALSEAALLCVNLKLRTPLGKPQETFTTIEGCLKSIARDITIPNSVFVFHENDTPAKIVTDYQVRSRWIIEFLQFLEKYIYNAAEGTATVLPSALKPVKTFFRTNWPTCREWYTRIRPAAIAVSLYSGHVASAVYHVQTILLTAAKNSLVIDLETVAVSITKALIKLQEPELLIGLYIFFKQTFDRKLPWLKAAAEQANSRYEIALEYYLKVKTSIHEKTEENNTVVSSTEISFVNEQIIECYMAIQDWDQLSQLIDNGVFTSKTLPAINTIREFENNVEYIKLCDWNVLNLESNQTTKGDLSYSNLLHNIETSLMNTALLICHRPDDIEKYSNVLNLCQTFLDNCLVEFSRCTNPFYLKEVNILQLACDGLQNVAIHGRAVTNPFKPSIEKLSIIGVKIESLGKILWWNQYFTKLNLTDENLFYSECLRLELIKSARKHNNVHWAKREVVRHFKNNIPFQTYTGTIDMTEFNAICNFLLHSGSMFEYDIWSSNNATALKETCKLLYMTEDAKKIAINMCANIALGVSQRLAMGEQNYDLREKGTRLLLTLSKWVQNENDEGLVLDANTPLTKLVTALPEIGLVDNDISVNVIPLSDSAVGKLLQFSVNQCPGLAKAWSSFASWCFRWGRKMVEYSSKTGDQLTETDKIQIENVMIGCTPQDFDAVCEILSKTKATCDDEDIDWNEINTSEMIENQLRSVPSLSNAYPEHLALLVDIWKQAQKRVFSYYELSADAYFKFLQLICSSEYINHSGEYSVVSATLRLLRLIVKHAMELQTVLESGLANTPTQPWKVIIPQLFSRLNHPETYVRKCVSDLLCRLAEDTPHLITFPAVVGAVENEQIDLTDISFPRSLMNEENDVQDYQDNSDTGSEKSLNNDLYSCFLDMVETLSSQAPETIEQVKLLVKELQRINLLWEELWLGTLAQHHSEFTKRVNQLEYEITKVKNNNNLTDEEKTRLINEKHRIIFEPIVFVLEQLNEITTAAPETPHEINFQKKFMEMIKEVIRKLKNPNKPDKPQESWAIIKQLQLKFQQRVNRRTSYILRMSDISPVLAKLRNTVISMPGVQTGHNIKITIKSIENNVAILPTKTKPKKLIFYGSDGKPYTYLFKGLEDLHLDERIMQFLSITNTMMARDAESNDNQTYRARHYSVIPLGPRSGLISWVDNVTPLFALYKRWQHREAAIATAKSNKPVNVLRPSEQFFSKLTPLLQSAGISADNRKEWPVEILKQVLGELSAETPSDLLWRELWCGSASPDFWWQAVRRFSFSLAVMSTIGYIIGLGDRHLDNVLVDLTSGEVVHIDYNVCFEKGKSLRVPEKVPFRMTPNLVRALGATGVEGIFRVASEHVLKVMRRGRETLLTLLEAFVYDPLVEWGGGGGGGGGGVVCSAAAARTAKRKRKAIEAKAAADMLAVRCCELRYEWNEHKELILEKLPQYKKNIENWSDHTEKLTALETRLQNCHHQIALVKEIESLGPNLNKHPLYDISQKYATYKQTKNAVEDAMKNLLKILEEYDKQIENYISAMETITGPQLVQWIQEYSVPNEQDSELIFDTIKEFLKNAGQSSMIAQCEQAETELIQSLQVLTALIRSTLEMLSQFAAISQYYPQSFTEHNKTIMFRKWIAAVLESKSPEMCREISAQFNSALAPEVPDSATAQQIVAYNYQMQTATAEASAKLNKMYERLQMEGGTEAVSFADENYNEAKSNLANYLRQDKSTVTLVEGVVIKMLCALNRRYLMLESSARCAGDCLVDLTSREGEWFLEEFSAMSAVTVELLAYIPIKAVSTDDENIAIAANCVKSSNLILGILTELNYNFQTIILAEALKKIQAEEQSVLYIINEVNNVILNTPCCLNELLTELELHFRYLVMEMEIPASNTRAIVSDLRARFEALLTGESREGEPIVHTPGRMLLMGFNGLFAPLTSTGAELINSIMSIPVPTSWKKIDQISEAIEMSAPLQNENIRSVLEDIFLIRRIEVIAEVFGMCAQMSSSFQGVGPVVVYDDDKLTRPVKRFIADYISRSFLGIHSRALGVVQCLLLRRRGVDITTEVEQKEIGASWKVSLDSLCGRSEGGRAATLCGALEASVRRRATLAYINRNIQSARGWLRATRARTAAHEHAHRSALPHVSQHAPQAALARAATELTAAAERLAAAGSRAHTLVTQVHQRVKWGAGANPALAAPLVSLEREWTRRGHRATQLQQAAAGLARAAASLAPSVGSTPNDRRKKLRAHLHAWEKACIISNKINIQANPVEEALMELLHPEGAIDGHWVQNVSALLYDMTQQLENDIECCNSECLAQWKIVESDLKSCNMLCEQHSSLVSTVRPLLRVLSLTAFNARLVAYDALWESLNGTHDPLKLTQLLDDIIDTTPHLYDDLLRLDVLCSDDNNTRRLVRQAANSNGKTNTTKQGENIQGAGVWKRVRLKLEGRDPDTNRRSTTHEQVDYIIKEATDIENLSLMYEGWMAWV